MGGWNLRIVAGILLLGIGVGVFWYARRGGSHAAHPETAGSASSSAAAIADVAAGATSGPGQAGTHEPRRTIPVTPYGPGTGSASIAPVPTAPAGTPLATAFDDEPRDDTWAGTTEATLRARLTAIADETHAQIVSIECRTRQCRVQIEGATDAAGLAYTRLGEEGGLEGVASQMIASAPVTLPDGTMHLDVYGQFDR